MDDRQFVIQFGAVLGVLMAAAIAFLILALLITSGDEEAGNDPLAKKVLEDRIKPVGEVYIGSVPAEGVALSGPAQPASAPDSGFASGKDVYEAVCAACHTSGVANAPKFGDQAAWAPHLQEGMDHLYQTALNGEGAMPAKGGRTDLSEEQVKWAVDYMVEAIK